MHSLNDKKLLNNLSDWDKELRVTPGELKKRKVFVTSFKYWYVSINEMPHVDRGDIQFIVWKNNDRQDIIYDEWKELLYIRTVYGLPGLAINRPKDKSVPRLHVHLYN